MTKHHIVLTGGGTAGHVMPNIALIDYLQQADNDWQFSYIGSYKGIERTLIKAHANINYHPIASGKLRRYWSWRNFIDPFKVIWGIAQSWFLCKKIKPDIIFSKGGFVSLPVVIAARLCGIPTILHESDLSPGLANRLCYRFVNHILLTFDDSKRYFNSSDKLTVTGLPIRPSLLQGCAQQGLQLLNENHDKPIILIIGGSLGAHRINDAVKQALPQLLKLAHVIHICGKDQVDLQLKEQYQHYHPFDYLDQEFANVLAASDFVVSRAGANTLYELLSMHKPHLLIPLSAKASRGDQIENAYHFEQLGYSYVLDQDQLSSDQLIASIQTGLDNLDTQRQYLKNFQPSPALNLIQQKIMETIE